MGERSTTKLAAEVSRYLETAERGLLSVVIEVDLPKPTFSFDTSHPDATKRRGRGHFDHVPDQKQVDHAVDQARTALETTLGRPLLWLASSHTFIGELSRDEILRVNELDCVLRIHKNRELPAKDRT